MKTTAAGGKARMMRECQERRLCFSKNRRSPRRLMMLDTRNEFFITSHHPLREPLLA
jgi:hypothetical protein